MDYERLFLRHLDLIDQIVRTTGRRRHLSPAEQEDLSGFVRLRLIENNYAALRKFQNRSTFWTYLASVIERLSMDFCIERWGRWRPSAMAERLGPDAVLLERLVHRDSHSFEEALELAHNQHHVSLSESQLRKLWETLPVRTRQTRVPEEAAAEVASSDTAEVNVEEAAHREELRRIERILTEAIARCTDHERMLLALRFDQGLKIAEIAAAIGGSPPTLHRHLAKVLGDLRAALQSAGVNAGDMSRLLGHQSIILSPLLRDAIERLSGNVRLFKRDE
ncbi:MAG: sigma-70 family RNA polymerase sigma factor [Vicinamibacterales bacterium]